jgi:hypothetical protein
MIRTDSISNQLIFNTVRLVSVSPNGHSQVGTGFIISVGSETEQIPFIVTCAHCIDVSGQVTLSCVSGTSDAKPDLGNTQTWTLDTSLLRLTKRHPTHDLIAIPFGPITNQAQAAGRPIFFRGLVLENFVTDAQREELTALESVVFVGYPMGLYDKKNQLPILRVGYTASPIWADFEGEPRFLIDAEVFGGSSGSPVFILNEGAYSTPSGIAIGVRFFLIGMVTSAINTTPGSVLPNQHIGIGSVLRADAIKAFLLSEADRFKGLDGTRRG